MKKVLITSIGIGVGAGIYDYISSGAFDWIRILAITAISIVILFAFNKVKK